MCADMGIRLCLEIFTDAEAARGIACRLGLGKTRHINVHYLWVQERVSNGDLTLHKVLGKNNPADLLTKYIDAETMNKVYAHFRSVC